MSPTKVGAQLTAVPPFSFHNVTARVFPLAANISSLNSFCDAYLNMDIPRSIVRFQPVIPYVYLVVLDYGDMSVDVGQRFWVSQREVSFAVPLERYEEVDGELVFQDLALVHPFIYVDDEWSLNTGREVYGWPKVFATMEADVNLWTKDPRSRTRLLTLNTSVYQEAYANQEQAKETFLEVYAEPPMSLAQLPLEALNPLNPIVALQSAVSSSITLAKDVADSLFRLNVRGFEPTHTLEVLQNMAGYGVDLATGILPEQLLAQFGRANGGGSGKGNDSAPPKIVVNNVNLKQYRDAENPDLPCYQELNYSTMGVNKVNRGGILGDMRMVAGDLSGGYRVALHRYESQPIVETLGLEVYETQATDGVDRSILKPLLPFWCDVEFHYGGGKPLCFRSARFNPAGGAGDEQSEGEKQIKKNRYWRKNRRTSTEVSDRKSEARARTPPRYLKPEDWRGVHSSLSGGGQVLFNAARGAAMQAIPGPFEYPDVTMRVFPLLADPGGLEKLCQEYLNKELDAAGLRFEPFGRYVYLTATNYGTEFGAMWSSQNNIGAWKEREVTFRVPVKWYRRPRGQGGQLLRGEDGEPMEWELIGAAMLSPFSFANTNTHVDSDREVTGRRTEKANIETPPGSWMEESGPAAGSTLLHLSTELLPALGVGQKAVDRTLMEIVAKDVLPENDRVGWRHVIEGWGSKLAAELKRKTQLGESKPRTEGTADHKAEFLNLKAVSVGLLASRAKFNEIVFRQCRDSKNPLHACFQALLVEQSAIEKVHDVREIEDRVHVAIHTYPSHPIVETLGLECKAVDATGSSVVQYLQPVRPFWMRVSMRQSLAKNICRREGAAWEVPDLDEWFSPESETESSSVAELRRMMEETVDVRGRLTEKWKDMTDRRDREKASAEVDRGQLPDWVFKELEAYREEAKALAEEAKARGDDADAQARADRKQGKFLFPRRLGLQLQSETWPDPGDVIRVLNRSEGVAEPQMVLESILSEEWEHWGTPRWFLGEGQKPQFCIPKSGTIGLEVAVEDQFYRQWRRGLRKVEHVSGWLEVGEEGTTERSTDRRRGPRRLEETP